MTSSSTPVPGDLTTIRIETLEANQDWATIAAIAAASDPHLELGCQALARGSKDAHAFSWLWALTTQRTAPMQDQALATFVSLPDAVSVPKKLEPQLTAFICDPGGTANALTARLLLLRSADEGLTLRVSHQVLSAAATETRPMPTVIDAAISALAQSEKPKDRNAVLAVTEALPPLQRLQVYKQLAGTRRHSEQEAINTAVTELLDAVDYPDAPILQAVRDVWSMLEPLLQRQLVAGPMTVKPFLQEHLFDPAFATRLGIEGILNATAPNIASVPKSDVPLGTGIGIVDTVIRQAEVETAAELLVRAHDVFPPGRLTGAVIQTARRIPSTDDAGAAVQRAAVLHAIAVCAISKGSTEGIGELVGVLLPGEFQATVGALDLTYPLAPGSLGQLLAAFEVSTRTRPGQSPQDADMQRHHEITEVLQALPGDDMRVQVVKRMLADLPTIPDHLCAFIAQHPELNATVTFAGKVDSYLTWLEANGASNDTSSRSTSTLLQLLSEAVEEHDARHALGMLTTQFDRRADEWKGKTDCDKEVLAALQQRPKLLCELALQLVDALNRPEAGHPPTARLVTYLTAAIEAGILKYGLVDHVAEPEGYLRLVAGRNPELNAVAARWFSELAPTPALVDLCIDANQQTSAPSPFLPVLEDYATQLGKQAVDTSLADEDRVAALELANEAFPTAARSAALRSRGASASQAFREAAAVVLAGSIGTHDEVARLTELHDAEPVQPIKDNLMRAIRRIESGDAAEALRNLLTLVESTHAEASVGIDIVVPYPQWKDIFKTKADQAIGAIIESPSSAINALCALAETLVELSCIAHYEAAGKTDSADKLRENRPGKPPVGNLIGQQQLLLRVPWFSAVSVLRKLRDVHVAPPGTLEPVKAIPSDAEYCLRLTKDIVDGWVSTMENPPN